MQTDRITRRDTSNNTIHPECLSPGGRMLLGMAIGDAFGARFENIKRDDIRQIDISSYEGQNRYTDDTQMAAAICHLMISGDTFSEKNLASFLISTYREDPRRGYSKITEEMLLQSDDAQAFLNYLSHEELNARKSDGSAMRALPIGFYPDLSNLLRYASLSSAITHGHPDAILATRGIALISHFRYHQNTLFRDLIPHILEILKPCMTRDQEEYITRVLTSGKINPERILAGFVEYGVPYTESIILFGAVLAVLYACGEDPKEVLIQSIQLGGDTDTCAAIALGAAMIRPGSYTLPGELYTGLEEGRYGKKWLIDLGETLTRHFPPSGL